MSVALVIAGGIAQALGVLLIAREYRDTRRGVDAYVNRTRKRYGSAVLAGGSALSATGTTAAPVGPMPPLERIQQLEARADAHDAALGAIRAEAQRGDRETEARLQERIRSAVRTTEASIMEDVNALGELMLGLNDPGGHRRRMASVLLLVVGLALATLGGVLS